MKGRRSRREGSRGARCEGKRAAHARRRFTAKQLHGAKRRFTCRQARFTRKNVLLSWDKSTFFRGAGGGGRTRTVVMPRDFKTSTESRREKTYEEVNAKNPCDCKALNGNWRKLETPRKRAFFLEKSDSERKWRERAKSKQAFLPMTNSDDKRKRHEEKSCVLSKAVSGLS